MYVRFLFLCLLFYSCNGPRMVQTDLYFGQLKQDGSMVTEQQWNEFVAHHVSKVFKTGSTIIQAHGNWFDTTTKTLVSEPSFIVTAIYPSSLKVSPQIDSLRIIYKHLYQQQSVLRVDKKVKARL